MHLRQPISLVKYMTDAAEIHEFPEFASVAHDPTSQVNNDAVRRPQSPQFERRAGNAVAFLSSLIVHVALLLILACWAFTAGKPSQGLLLSADIDNSTETALDELQTFELAVESEQEIVTFRAEPDLTVDVDISLPTLNTGSTPDASLPSVSMESVAESLKPQGRGRGASFFGAYAEGNRFIYVLDSSRSMKGDRWLYACQQLLDSLNGLKPGQEFFVICFDMETTFLFNGSPQSFRYYEADNDTIDRVKNWLRSRILGRATMPAQALMYALEANPDAIFLLSDGELQDNSLSMLRLINSKASERRQIPIHTVHLFSDQGRLTLEQIALENQGSFTPIEGHRGFGFFRSR